MSKFGGLLGKGKKKNRRDYRRRKNEELEWVEFEDEEYVYYVKAVPKTITRMRKR